MKRRGWNLKFSLGDLLERVVGRTIPPPIAATDGWSKSGRRLGGEWRARAFSERSPQPPRKPRSVDMEINEQRLFEAIEEEDAWLVRQALAQGASPMAWGAFGELPMIVAARKGNVDCMQALLEAGADLDARNQSQLCPLEAVFDWFEKSDKPKVVKWLLSKGANPNNLDVGGSSPMHELAEHGDVACLVEYIKAGARLDVVNHEGRSPEEIARSFGHEAFADHLARAKQLKAARLEGEALDESALPGHPSGKRRLRV
jgi:hypothetical protein